MEAATEARSTEIAQLKEELDETRRQLTEAETMIARHTKVAAHDKASEVALRGSLEKALRGSVTQIAEYEQRIEELRAEMLSIQCRPLAPKSVHRQRAWGANDTVAPAAVTSRRARSVERTRARSRERASVSEQPRGVWRGAGVGAKTFDELAQPRRRLTATTRRAPSPAASPFDLAQRRRRRLCR